MAITKQKKGEILAKVTSAIEGAKSVVFVNFHNLTVAQERDLRSKLRAEGVGYTVAKKSLIRKALEGRDITGELPELPGEIAIAFSEDELAPAREAAAFAKTHEGHLALEGGIFGGAFMNKGEIAVVANIPGLQTLRAQFVQLINSPLQRFAVVLSEAAKKRAV